LSRQHVAGGTEEDGMNWEALGAIAEALGAVGVIVTLAYLATQIRQNSRLLRASTSAATAQVNNSQSQYLIQDAEVARIWWDGLADRESLSEADRRRFDPLITIQLQGASLVHAMEREGIGSLGEWEENRRGLRWQLEQPGIRQYFRAYRENFSSDFCQIVDGVIREIEAAA
jgi:hypothetical protein